jgi:ankyrin repeat protein
MDAQEELFTAIKNGDQAFVDRLISDDPSLVDTLDGHGLTPVLTATYYQHPEIASFLVERGAFLTLFEACAVGNLDKVGSALKAQPDHINAFAPDGFQPMGLAAFFGHTDIVKFLLSVGAEFDTPSQNGMMVTPLNSAAATGRLDIARMLLERGANPNARQADDFVPLHAAAQNGQREMAELLLKHGADKTFKNRAGKSAQEIAAEKGALDLAELLRP